MGIIDRVYDETWHRLLMWTWGQAPSERLAGQILAAEGFEAFDPSHPLGGQDGGADGRCQKDGNLWILAVYFPRGQQTIRQITDKLTSDVDKGRAHNPYGVVFVTNQELRLAERADLRKVGGDIEIELYHIERVAHILDRPPMASTRKQYVGIPAGPPPMLVAAEVTGAARCFSESDELRDRLVEIEENALRQRAQELRDNPPDPLRYAMSAAAMRTLGHDVSDQPPKPMSDDEIVERVAAFRAGLVSRWGACQDYLAAIVWPSLEFRITNNAKSFLTDVQVILTFHGAAGLQCSPPEAFEFERLKDPSWEPPFDPSRINLTLAAFTPSLPAEYPVEWENNDEGDLEVTINLAQLRPHPPWCHAQDDVVLVLRDTTLEAVTVTYTVTAHGYGAVFEGEPLTIPVERVDVFDATKAALEASRPE